LCDSMVLGNELECNGVAVGGVDARRFEGELLVVADLDNNEVGRGVANGKERSDKGGETHYE